MDQKIAMLMILGLFLPLTGCIGAAPCQEATVADHWTNSIGEHTVFLADGRVAVTDQATYIRVRDGITYGFEITPMTGEHWVGPNRPGQTTNQTYRIVKVCKEGHL